MPQWLPNYEVYVSGGYNVQAPGHIAHANGNKLAKIEEIGLKRKLKLRELVATRYAEAGASKRMGPDHRQRR